MGYDGMEWDWIGGCRKGSRNSGSSIVCVGVINFQKNKVGVQGCAFDLFATYSLGVQPSVSQWLDGPCRKH